MYYFSLQSFADMPTAHFNVCACTQVQFKRVVNIVGCSRMLPIFCLSSQSNDAKS